MAIKILQKHYEGMSSELQDYGLEILEANNLKRYWDIKLWGYQLQSYLLRRELVSQKIYLQQ